MSLVPGTGTNQIIPSSVIVSTPQPPPLPGLTAPLLATRPPPPPQHHMAHNCLLLLLVWSATAGWRVTHVRRLLHLPRQGHTLTATFIFVLRHMGSCFCDTWDFLFPFFLVVGPSCSLLPGSRTHGTYPFPSPYLWDYPEYYPFNLRHVGVSWFLTLSSARDVAPISVSATRLMGVHLHLNLTTRRMGVCLFLNFTARHMGDQ